MFTGGTQYSFTQANVLLPEKVRTLSFFPDESVNADQKVSGPAQYVVKTVICGDYGVGKTSLIRRFVENTFDHDYKPSIGVNILTKVVDIEGRRIKLQLFDTGGQERFRSMRQRYYVGAHAVIFVFDVTRASSATAIETQWIDEVEGVLGSDFERLVLANKADLAHEREVSGYAAKQATQRIQGNYYETSALSGVNVNEAFTDLAERLLKKLFPEA
ncbi:MAG: Rab family GTPase [Candidatus Hermodarchaeota archaeon]|nr:Rab family GTPase [Candidatus Hermodarchaeota archaeon]